MSVTINISETSSIAGSAVSTEVSGQDAPPPAESMSASVVENQMTPGPPASSDIQAAGEASSDSAVPTPPGAGDGFAGDVSNEAGAPAPPEMDTGEEATEAMTGDAPPPVGSESSGIAMAAVEGAEDEQPIPPLMSEDDTVSSFNLADLDKDPPQIEDESTFSGENIGVELLPPLPDEDDDKPTSSPSAKKAANKPRKKKNP